MPGTLPLMTLQRCAREHRTSVAASVKFKTEGTTPLLNSATGTPRSLGRVECAAIGGTAEADIPFSGFAKCVR